MITKEEYQEYLGVDTAPVNLKRLEFLSIHSFKSIMILPIPTTTDVIYDDFKKALMEQINYFSLNPELIEESNSSGYTLGSFSEGDSNQNDVSKSINKISPSAYNILMSCGLLYSGLGRC